MKKKFDFILSMFCCLASSAIFAQTVTKTTTSPVAGTVCPEFGTVYEVSRPENWLAAPFHGFTPDYFLYRNRNWKPEIKVYCVKIFHHA